MRNDSEQSEMNRYRLVVGETNFETTLLKSWCDENDELGIAVAILFHLKFWKTLEDVRTGMVPFKLTLI